MSSLKKEKQNGVVHFFQHPGSKRVDSFRYKISGILVLLIFSIGVRLQAQTMNLDSLLTKEELSWLKANKDNIRYAPDPSWPPADYVEEGVHKGFISDYILFFEQMLGCKFNRVYYSTWAEVLEGLKKGEIDFVGGIQKTVQREDFLLFTEPFLKVDLGLITKADFPFDGNNKQINSMKLACIKEYSSTQYIEETYPDARIVYVNNDYEALLQVVYGITDAAVVDYMTASYLAQNKGLTHLKHAGFLDFYWNLSFAARHELPELCSIIDKRLHQIDEEQHQKFVENWVDYDVLQDHEHGIYEEHKEIIIGIFLFVLLALVVVGIFSLLLKKQVNSQTLALREARDKAKKNEEKYKLLAENTRDVIWLSDLQLNLSYISPSIEKMVGYTPEEFLDLPLDKRVPLFHRENLMNLLNEELRQEQQGEKWRETDQKP
jgi:ABC-type amino acid transport substrate-binding protein